MKVMHKHILMTNAIKKGKHEENIGYGILKQYTYIQIDNAVSCRNAK